MAQAHHRAEKRSPRAIGDDGRPLLAICASSIMVQRMGQMQSPVMAG